MKKRDPAELGGSPRLPVSPSPRLDEGQENHRDRHAGSWRDEIDDFVRAISGAFIFAIPLLYTMEMWWIGITADLWKLLLFLGVAFLIALGLARSRTGGFKQDTDLFGSVEQAVDVVAVGLVAAVVVLAVLNRIHPGDPLDSILGKVMLQAVPLSIGASVANAIFSSGADKNRQGEEPAAPGDAGHELRVDLGATVVGAVFISFAIAPTEEVPMLATELAYAHELALIGLSLLISYAIVFASGYGAGQGEQPGPFQHPLPETALAYVVSLLVALAALALFDQVKPGDPLGHVVSMVLVLGLPAAVGGAAGRLVA